MGACTVYAPLDGKPKREWLAADFLNGFGRCLAVIGAQEAKGVGTVTVTAQNCSSTKPVTT